MRDWKTYTPNVITCFRIALSICLLPINPDTIEFLLIYFVCGTTDIIDGYLARKWSVNSKQGAMLDSVADFIFIAVLLFIFIPRLHWQRWMLLWITTIFLIRVTSLVIGAFKFHTIAFVHTYGNKVTGLVLFFFPFYIHVCGMTGTMILVGAAASISSLEELIIVVKTKSLNRDCKGLFLGEKNE